MPEFKVRDVLIALDKKRLPDKNYHVVLVDALTQHIDPIEEHSFITIYHLCCVSDPEKTWKDNHFSVELNYRLATETERLLYTRF